MPGQVWCKNFLLRDTDIGTSLLGESVERKHAWQSHNIVVASEAGKQDNGTGTDFIIEASSLIKNTRIDSAFFIFGNGNTFIAMSFAHIGKADAGTILHFHLIYLALRLLWAMPGQPIRALSTAICRQLPVRRKRREVSD